MATVYCVSLFKVTCLLREYFCEKSAIATEYSANKSRPRKQSRIVAAIVHAICNVKKLRRAMTNFIKYNFFEHEMRRRCNDFRYNPLSLPLLRFL